MEQFFLIRCLIRQGFKYVDIEVFLRRRYLKIVIHATLYKQVLKELHFTRLI